MDKGGEASSNRFVIAALGASAGGLEALENFFQHTPSDTGLGFIVVQHLAPDHKSSLSELLANHTEMPVEEARDNIEARPNRVYIIPPNATLTVEGGKLRVKTPDAPRGQRMPIDTLFRSLAEDREEYAVCIMLSGTGSDGTIGIAAIKENGGMAMAQSIETAKYDTILRSAIATGLVDHILPVEEMAAKPIAYAAHLNSIDSKSDGMKNQIGKHLGQVVNLLRRRVGHDFSGYKLSTISRRLQARLDRFFIKHDTSYQVKNELRDLCMFSLHSILKDPPFSRQDLISCRNVMIYLDPETQERLVSLFHYALRRGGFLFLGPSESVTAHRELFQTVDKKGRIFQRREGVPQVPVPFSLTDIARFRNTGGTPAPDREGLNIPKRLASVILQRYTPACVVVQENGDAVYLAGPIDRYLSHPAGSPDNNVLNTAREGLRIPLRTALYRAVATHERVEEKQISVQTNGSVTDVDLSVERWANSRTTCISPCSIRLRPAAASAEASRRLAIPTPKPLSSTSKARSGPRRSTPKRCSKHSKAPTKS